jgi:tetratricopeptide (TPR) repeat protein
MSRYCYERELFATAEKLLQNARRFCKKNPKGTEPKGAELHQADIYYTRACIDSESNRTRSALYNFQKQDKYLQRAKAAGLLGETGETSFREVLSIGGLANGHMGVNDAEKAEPLYRRCLEEAAKFENAERGIYENHLATCLDFQEKYPEAESVLREVIEFRKAQYGAQDTESFR